MYAVPGIVADDPLPPLAESIVGILEAANSPLRPIEIGVELLNRGEPIDATDPTKAVCEVTRLLRLRTDWFCESDDGYWKLKG